MDSAVASPIQFQLDQDDILWKRDAEVFFKSFRNGVVAELASLAKQSGEDHEAWAKKIVGELEARISVSSTEMLVKQFQRYDVRVQERFAGIEATIGGVDERFAKQEQDMAIFKTRYAYGGAGRSKSASLNLDFAGSATNDASIASCELPAAPTNGSLQEDESVALGGTSLPTSDSTVPTPEATGTFALKKLDISSCDAGAKCNGCSTTFLSPRMAPTSDSRGRPASAVSGSSLRESHTGLGRLLFSPPGETFSISANESSTPKVVNKSCTGYRKDVFFSINTTCIFE
jgi:hypothetical protein